MADAFAPPSGPPPPKVPAGWKAQWNDQYKEWFYVNIYTKKSQWDRPTEPIYPPAEDGAPDGPPPGYANPQPVGAEKGSNNPYLNSSATGGSSSHNIDKDEAYARQLQAEEQARAQGRPTSRNAQQDYMNTPMPSYDQQQLPPRQQEKSKGGFLGKLLGKHSAPGGQQQYQQYGSPGPANYGSPQPGYGYGAPPPQQYGGGYGGGYPPQQGYYGGGGGYQQPPKKSGGIGAGGAAALGLGGGLVGGMLLEDAISDHDQNEYDQGYDQGQDQGDYGGGDDFGGGDF